MEEWRDEIGMVCYFSGLVDLLSLHHSIIQVFVRNYYWRNSAVRYIREHSACNAKVTSGLLNLVTTDVWGQKILYWGGSLRSVH